jgi:extracellular factor (EF) 3-hydroxypalmitic acid methyl ester biosynthesis protein
MKDDLEGDSCRDEFSAAFCDYVLQLIESGSPSEGMNRLASRLTALQHDPHNLLRARALLQSHRLHSVLLEDPHTSRAFHKPRGYAGDAELIDLYYLRQPPTEVSAVGKRLFDVTSGFVTSEAVRWRLKMAEDLLIQACAEKQRVCSLACGHFREADVVQAADRHLLTGVDQDAVSLEAVRTRCGEGIRLEQANALRFLRTVSRGSDRFDLIYTLGLTDYLDAAAFDLLIRLMTRCLAPGGRIVLANFLPGHVCIGWMEACMDWQLIYRDEREIGRRAHPAGLTMTAHRDPTDSIVWCEMRQA